MKREDVLAKIFDAEFCDPKDKEFQERELEALFLAASEQTKKPLYLLKPAFLKVYPNYRAKRLGKELPNIPTEIRNQ
jgi:hypothetical protein